MGSSLGVVSTLGLVVVVGEGSEAEITCRGGEYAGKSLIDTHSVSIVRKGYSYIIIHRVVFSVHVTGGSHARVSLW